MNIKIGFHLILVLILTLTCTCDTGMQIQGDSGSPLVKFGYNELESALFSVNGKSINLNLERDENMDPQSFSVNQEKSGFYSITGGDYAGLMYGLLDIADRVRTGEDPQKLGNFSGEAFISRRGLKFNIPLDARTPSFDDTGDAAQNNILTVWDMEFWTDFLDDMARYRYNTLTLWTPNPFPAMIRIPDMPDASIDDVYATTLELTGVHGEWSEPHMVSDEVLSKLEKIKEISIEEKISFWQKVMRHARDRGIDIYFITWNIAPNAVANPVKPWYRCWLWNEPLEEKPGLYGVTHDIYNQNTIAYYRKAVKTFIETYPDLKGFGVTSGEHMPRWLDDIEREKWLWNTYGLGIKDALVDNPDREIDFIHRMWWTNMDNVMHYWGKYPGRFDLSFKYSRARLYSDPAPVFADPLLKILEKYGLQSWWNLRNDDIFMHRWGNPDFVRELFKNFPLDKTAGYHMGSDGYVWARNSTDIADPGQLEIRKHWYSFMLWGMLGYNPEIKDEYFIRTIESRMPDLDASGLFQAWKASSQIIPLVNKFHFVDWDLSWSVEGCFGTTVKKVYPQISGFHKVDDFIRNKTMEGMGLLNPADYVEAVLSGSEVTKTTPLEVASKLQRRADQALELVSRLRFDPGNSEQQNTVDDIKSMCYLGRYYASKILGATELEFYRKTSKETHQENSINHLLEARDHWEAYAGINADRYLPQVLARPGKLDLNKTLHYVNQDIEIAANWEQE